MFDFFRKRMRLFMFALVVLIVPSFLSPLWLVLLGLFGWRLSAHRQGRDAGIEPTS